MKKFLCLLFIIIFNQSTWGTGEHSGPISGATQYSFSPGEYCPTLYLWYESVNMGSIIKMKATNSFWLKKGGKFGLSGDGYKYEGTLGDQTNLGIECLPSTKEIKIWQ